MLEPLLFLDYFASGKLEIETAAAFVSVFLRVALSPTVLLLVVRPPRCLACMLATITTVTGTRIGAVNRDKVLPRTL